MYCIGVVVYWCSVLVGVSMRIVDVDMVTPLCSQVTYEGLLDDIFGIHCGVVEFDKEVTGTDKSMKVSLNSTDEVAFISVHYCQRLH